MENKRKQFDAHPLNKWKLEKFISRTREMWLWQIILFTSPSATLSIMGNHHKCHVARGLECPFSTLTIAIEHPAFNMSLYLFINSQWVKSASNVFHLYLIQLKRTIFLLQTTLWWPYTVMNPTMTVTWASRRETNSRSSTSKLQHNSYTIHSPPRHLKLHFNVCQTTMSATR